MAGDDELAATPQTVLANDVSSEKDNESADNSAEASKSDNDATEPAAVEDDSPSTGESVATADDAKTPSADGKLSIMAPF